MIAAIYARKSTDQTGVADEQRSVARQVAHARAYSQRKGWTVDEACIFVERRDLRRSHVCREVPYAEELNPPSPGTGAYWQ